MLTDKTVECHNYEAIYRPLFGPNKLEGKDVLEIGVYKGGSVRWWLDEFSANSVVGMDVQRYNNGIYDDRATYLMMDAYTHKGFDAAKELGPYDLIVEDGPHTLKTQVFTAAEYSRLLKPGGWLCIEDIWTYEDAIALSKVLPDEMAKNVFIATTDEIGSLAGSPSRMLIAWNGRP